jgi:hypothetical protein
MSKKRHRDPTEEEVGRGVVWLGMLSMVLDRTLSMEEFWRLHPTLSDRIDLGPLYPITDVGILAMLDAWYPEGQAQISNPTTTGDVLAEVAGLEGLLRNFLHVPPVEHRIEEGRSSVMRRIELATGQTAHGRSCDPWTHMALQAWRGVLRLVVKEGLSLLHLRCALLALSSRSAWVREADAENEAGYWRWLMAGGGGEACGPGDLLLRDRARGLFERLSLAIEACRMSAQRSVDSGETPSP